MRLLLIHIFLLLSITSTFAGDPDRLEVVVISDNNLCDNSLTANGSAYAVIIEDDGKEDDKLKDYTINWYSGNSATGTPVNVGATYDQMANGTYTVQAIHDKSSFVDEVTIVISNSSNGPDVYVESIKDAKNCKENDGSAKVRVRADFPQEGPDHSHDDIKDCKHGICWSFVWYEGNNPFIGTVVATGADAKQLKPGTYAIVVTNESDGCQTIISLTVGLEAEEPVLDGNVLANITDCNDPTMGSLEAFVTGEPNNKFEFDWFIGDFVTAAPDFNDQRVLTDLAAGNYTVVATAKSTGCSSNPLTFTVADLTSVPVVLANLDLEQTSCDAANPNGAVSATADGTTAGYAFEWFSGQSTVNLIATGPSMTGLAAGFYTVRATNTSDPNSQNCSATAEVEVTESLITPSPINSTIVDQTFCINPNGSLAVTVGGNTSDYTFYWFDGNIASPDINSPDFTGPSYSNLLAGDYTLIVENNVTSCTTTAQAFTVADLTAEPTIALASSADLTSCAAPNGAISVTADGGTAGHTFRWFTGISTAAADEILPNPGASITGLTAGTYTVLVQNTTTGCTEIFDHTVVDVTSTPVPTTTVVDQSQCDPINGSITADVGGATAGFNFYWFDGNVATPDITAADFTGAAYTGLLAGEYTLVVENDASKCTSAPEVITVAGLTPTISGTIAVTPQTSCDPAAPNGQLIATGTGGAGAYTYVWYSGTDTSIAANQVSTTATASGLSAQTYTVVITNVDTGCSEEVSEAVASAIVLPAVDVDNIIPNTVCNTSTGASFDGEIEASVGTVTAGYTFYWFDGDIASPDITAADYSASNIYSGIQSGVYTLVVVEDATSCESDREVITVPDATPVIGGTIAITPQTSCDPAAPNGQLIATGTGGAGTYSYVWYSGTDTSIAANQVSTTATASGLSAQTYTVVITNVDTGCSEEVSEAVPSAIVLPAVDVDNIIPNTVCNTSTGASFDGEIEASVGTVTAGYTFYWFDGDIASPDITAADYSASNIYSGIQSGVYTLVVVEDATSCESDREVITVPDATPVIGGTIAITPQTSCDPAAPNGQLIATGTGGAGAYTYVWYSGTDTSIPANQVSTTATASGLSAQTYTVVITNVDTGCSEEVSEAVPSAIVLPAVDVDNIIPNTVCNTSTGASFDGEIEASVGTVTAGYTFYWFDGDIASPDITAADYSASNIYSGIQSGVYTLVVVEDATSCESDREVITVPDATPVIGGTIAVTPQTSCDPAAPNGQLIATGTGGAGAYTYVWYSGTDTSIPANQVSTTATASGLSAQTYTVVITNVDTGCSEEVSEAVPSAIVLPAVDVDNIIPNTVCNTSTGASFDGEIEASVGTVTAGYTFYWFDGDIASPDITAADYSASNIYSGIQSGVYTLVVVEDATSCESDREVITVPDATPVIGGTIAVTPQTSCDPAAPNGQLIATGTGGAGAYTYVWYSGTDTSIPANQVSTTATASGLSAQTYTVVITNVDTGCSEEVSEAVPSAIVLPAVDVDNIIPNTVCNTSTGASFDGEIEASVGTVTAGYTFYWFDGDIASPDITAADYSASNIYSGIQSGVYTLVVVEDATSCESDREVITVPDASPTIDGTIVITSQTSCDALNPNGVLTSTGIGGTGPYSYVWYSGTDTTIPANQVSTSATASGLSAQTYTVVITDQNNGCSTEISYAVPSAIKKPVITIDPSTDISANTICNPALATAPDYDGAIQAAVTYDGAPITLADYRFDWYTGSDASGAITFTGTGADTYSDLAPGDYTLIVTRVNPGPGFQCSSELITVNVPNNITKPTASFTKDALQTSCGVPNGQLTATGASGSGSYAYEWFVGTGPTTPFVNGTDGTISAAPGATISGIDAGDYTVRVTDLATGCQTVQDIYLDENIIDPVVTLAVTTPMSDCSFDGVITPTITSANAAPSGHTFTWHAGQSTTDPVIAITTDAAAANPELSTANTGVTIYAGYYTVVATDIFTGCASSSETIFLDRPAPLFDVLTNVNFQPSTCGVDEGIITAWVDLDADGNPSLAETNDALYTFEWYQGNPTDIAASYYTNPSPIFVPNATLLVDQTGMYPGSVPAGAGANLVDYFAPENANAGASIYGIPSGRYTVVVTDDITGCKEFVGVDLPFLNGADVSVADVNITNSSNCSSPNGSLQVTALNNIPGGRTFADYIYNWYEGTNEILGSEIVDGTATVITTALLNQNGATMGLSAGYYTVVPIETFGSFCRLTPFTVYLDSIARQPVITETITNSTSCLGNGIISIVPSKDADDTTPVTTYSFAWSSGETTPSISNKLPGDYTVTVTDDGTTCSKTQTFTIQDQRVVPEITAIATVAQTFCAPVNGSLTIADADVSPGLVSDYSFTVYFEGTAAGDIIAPTTTVNATDVVFSGLTSGQYYITATRTTAGDGQGCTSAFKPQTVADDTDLVLATLSQTANTSCDPALNSDASITLNMTTPTGPAPISGATYNITVDTQPGAALSDQAGVSSPFEFGADTPNGEDVVPGTYEFTIQNTVSGCTVKRNITVEDNPEPIIFSRSDLDVVGQEICNPDGSITVTNIGPAAVGDYTFSWYDGKANFDTNTAIAGVTGPVLDVATYPSIDAGIYYVVATRNAATDPGSACSSVGVRVEIPVTQVTPVLSLAQTANTACDANSNSDATITVTMSTPSGDAGIAAANYDISFTTRPAGATVANVTGVASPYTFTSIPADLIVPGVYTIQIRNTVSNCVVSRNITVEDNPEPIVFSKSDLTVVGQEVCNPDGSITVNTIGPAAVGDYTFSWYDGKANFDTNTPIAGVTGPVLDVATYPSIDAGIYYVVATRNAATDPGSACSSVGVRVEIPVTQVTPVLSLAQTANTACDANSNSDATITVTMSTPSGDAGIAAANYDISFTTRPAGATVANVTGVASPYTFTSIPADLIVPGVYTIQIRNTVSNCVVSKSITVEDNPEPIIFSRSDLDVVGQEICNPDGSITVTNIGPAAVGDYTFSWYDGKANFDTNTAIAGVTGPVLDVATYPSIDAGIYYVVATRNAATDPGSACSSVGVRVEIPVTQVTPVLSLAQTANTACDANSNSDATITVTMSTPSGDAGIAAANYDISFTTRPAGATVANVTGVASPYTFTSIPADLIVPGVYTIQIRNTVSNCVVSKSITVEDNPEPIIFSRSDLDVVGQEICNPDGSITVTNIGPAAVGDYTFSWYDGKANFDTNTAIAGVTGPVLDVATYPSIDAGIYYVVATRNAATDPGSACSSVGVRVEIPVTQVTPVLSLAQTANTACDANSNSDATITVTMSTPSGDAGIAAANYDISFTTRPAGATVANVTGVASPYTFTSIPADLIVPGVYTIQIRNTVSNCVVSRNITVENNPEPIVFSKADLTIVGQEVCNPDGSITVNTIGPAAVGDYTFSWYDGKANFDSNTPIAGVTGPVLDVATYPSIDAGIYYVVATRNAATDPGSACSSVGVRVEIPVIQVTPVLSLAQTANTACDANSNSDATITVTMSTPSGDAGIAAANYDISFTTRPAGATVANVTGVASPYTFTSIPADLIVPGVYTIQIRNTVSNCVVSKSITVEDNPEPIIFSRSDLDVVGQEICNPDGSITVTNIGPAAVGDYTFSWYDGKANFDTNTAIAGVTGPVLDVATYPSIDAGIYYVVATRNAATDPGSACSSVGVRVEIPVTQVTPVLSLAQTANTACDANSNSDATITVTMSTPSGDAGIAAANYDISFTTRPAGATVANVTGVASPYTFTSIPADLILPGLYEVQITNLSSNCTVTRSIIVEDNPEPILLSLADLAVVDATNCNPDGSITVTNIGPLAVADYTYTWYDGEANYASDTPIAGATGNVLDNTTYATIHPGIYYVKAIRNTGINPGSTCVSNAVRVEIEDASENPDVLIVENNPNFSCDPTNPNGSLTASVPGFATSDYTFEWFIGLNNTTNAVAAANISGTEGETISGLAAGNYTLRITDNTTPGQTCATIESYLLGEDLTISVPKNVSFDIIPQSDCFDSGSITVTALSPGVPADFSYEWYYESFDASGLIAGETSASLNGRPAGTYFVMITNIATSCRLATVIEKVIPNTSTAPVISLFDAKPNTNCDPNAADGFLEVLGDGQSLGYNFTWYNSEMPLDGSETVLASTNRIDQLDSGYYTVIVQNVASNCSDTSQFYVKFVPELPKLDVYSTPVTSCVVDNGGTFARVYNLAGNYQFNWYIGTSVGAVADFTGPFVNDLPVGDYTVQAINLDAPACFSEPVTVSVVELIEVPSISIKQLSPNTYCDPAKVNGVAEVAVYYLEDDDVTDTIFVTSNFIVEWNRTVNVPANPAEFTGRINGTLAPVEYTVNYTNPVSGCVYTDNITITEDLLIVPPPAVEITAQFDSCEEPNGAAEIVAASLNPNYLYNWYYNEIGNAADFVSTSLDVLEIGTYLVTATDTVSGCISEPTSIEIVDNRKAPEITLTLTSETCGAFDGSATIALNEDYEYRAIEWETPEGTTFGTSYEGFTAGDYSVTVIGSNGCAYTREFSIVSEIEVFNGFSPNNDGANDEWNIGCIESFEDSRVEIYNRAGALVFTTEKYGASDNVFRGLGNRGLYAGNRELPDGTYFYVIIKGDGSEAVTGYIEMFR